MGEPEALRLLDRLGEPEARTGADLLRGAPGIGPVTATTLLAALPELGASGGGTGDGVRVPEFEHRQHHLQGRPA